MSMTKYIFIVIEISDTCNPVRVSNTSSGRHSSSGHGLRLSASALVDALAAGLHTLAEAVEYRHGLFPRDARIRDRLAILEARGASSRDVLAALDEVALQHHAHDEVASLAAELGRDVLSDLDLAAVLLGRVAVAAVDLAQS
jgi:hypothetical protein